MATDGLAVAASIISAAAETPAVQDLLRRVENGGALSVAGVSAGAHAFLLALLHHAHPDRVIVAVTPNLKAQESLHQDLETWLSTEPQPPLSNRSSTQAEISPDPTRKRTCEFLRFHPAWEILPHEDRLPHADVIGDRVATLLALNAGRVSRQSKGVGGAESPIIVTSVSALMQRTFAPDELGRRTRRLNRGDSLPLDDLAEWLEEQGYEPEAQVSHPGEFSRRGGILDVFPITEPWPVRLEFFGDELESLRHFDPITQVSSQEVVSVVLTPAGELGLLKQGRRSADVPSNLSTPVTLLMYLPARSLIVFCEPEELTEHAAEYSDRMPKDDPFIASWDTVLNQIQAGRMTLLQVSELTSSPGPINCDDSDASASEHLDEVTSRPLPPIQLQSLDAWRPMGPRAQQQQIVEAHRREFFAQLDRWIRQGYRVHVFFNNEGERDRFVEIQQEYGFPEKPDAAPGAAQIPQSSPKPFLHLGTLARGFLFEDARLVVVTDAEIFGRYKIQRPRRLKATHAATVRSALDINFTDLEEGDLVVHVQHGIGRYLGLQSRPVAPARRSDYNAQSSATPGQECLVIEYAASGDDSSAPKLYVPASEAHLVSKYVGAGKVRPPLDTLGGTRWGKTKEQAERAVRDLASELLALQAARESLPGHAFGEDVPWQREFESAFIYEETPDQVYAITDTKRDMEVARPMDRLICGDVGFGKTEVAIRAAFKAVMGGKQVAILVPTTVLAQQHFNTFTERMADYPVRVELLSRFRSRRDVQRVIRELASGAADVVVGTHRLLQSDVAFKDLGLVVIDEEQRFGVLQKEKFKLLRQLVDVLTLSATPIPRTLYLALTGARDMSTIATPPQDRLPVETIVVQYDERLIRDAIQREMERGGQVFFLHNRVMTIDTVARKLHALVPKARIVVGHGQMESDELEKVMTRFVNGDADVLLSTTIIESGLDIPNANTIIIDRADRFGLSDLYQLRGRVGRYKHQAYAYLLLPRHASLLSDVRKRISAIRQHSSLGSGFKIAMRDLEIRGAGNLLGAEQSGHITAVGFELYCQLLKQSVSSLKGEKVKPRVEVRVSIDFLGAGTDQGSIGQTDSVASIPTDYISDSRQRIEIYRKLAQLTERSGIDALRQELRDRFGKSPAAVELLLQVAEIRILAGERGITSVETDGGKIMLTRGGDFISPGGRFPRITKHKPADCLKEIRRFLIECSAP